ncbi:MAG: ATP-binding cassette domain-containing protein [Nakamurella sp.]
MIEVQDLSKQYGDKVAVDGLSFVVRPGIVTGFLGPNGSGKSTTMRMIAGLDRPTAGRVTVNGGDYRSAAAPMAELGVLLEAKAVHTGRSARNHLLALARTNGISPRRVAEVIDLVGLHHVAGQRVGGFSLGMAQRLGVASALLGNPQTVVLDEPVNGLDPEGVRWIRTMLKDLAADGHTVFVSSHLMSEMAQTATRVVVIGRGRLIADTTVEDFIARASTHSVTVRTPDPHRLRDLLTSTSTSTSTGTGTGTGASAGTAGVSVDPGQPDVLTVDGLTAAHVGTIAWQHHIPVYELTVAHASLEEAFMTLTEDSVEYRATPDTATRSTPATDTVGVAA